MELDKNAKSCLKQIQEAIAYKSAAVRLLTTHLTNYPSKTNNTCKSKDKFISGVPLWTSTKDELVLTVKKLTDISSVWRLNAV